MPSRNFPMRGPRIRVPARAASAPCRWTIDEPAQMRELLDLGVHGLVTDRPDLLRDVLVERGVWQQAG